MAEDRWSAYLDSVVEIDLPDGRVRVEPAEVGAAGVFPLGNETVHILTAFVSAERHSPENELRQHRLLDELGARGLTLLPALGGDSGGAHTEDSVVVIGLTDYEALAVGKSYAQDAIFRWTASEFSRSSPAPTAERGIAAGSSQRLGFDGIRRHDFVVPLRHTSERREISLSVQMWARSHVERLLQEEWEVCRLVQYPDGGYPWRGRTAHCWVGIQKSDNEPLVIVNAHAAMKVKKSYKLLNELNEIQCKTPAVIHWCRGVVWVTATTSSAGLTRSVLSDLMRHVEGIADDIGPMITAVYGGSTPHQPPEDLSAAEDVA